MSQYSNGLTSQHWSGQSLYGLSTADEVRSTYIETHNFPDLGEPIAEGNDWMGRARLAADALEAALRATAYGQRH